MRKITMAIVLATVASGAFACSSDTRTVVRREVQTETVPAPVVLEKQTIIREQPVQPQQRVYEERRTIIEDE